MSIVNNGRISSNDQKVDNKKFDKGYDEISFEDAPWRKKKQVKCNDCGGRLR